MKNSTILISLICIFFFTTNTFAQITITNGDIANVFAIGNSTTIHSDTGQSTVDIGTPGGGNNWDFTMLQSNLLINYQSVDSVSTPHILMTFPVQILQHIVLVQFNAVA